MLEDVFKAAHKALKARRYEEAGAIAATVLHRFGPEFSDFAHGIMEKCAPHAPVIKLALAVSYAADMFDFEVEDGVIVRMFEECSDCGIEEVANSAKAALANYHVANGRHHVGLKMLRELADDGYLAAYVTMGLVHVNGGPGLKPDLGRGLTLLCEALEREAPRARIVLARVLLDNDIGIEGVDPFELLEEEIEMDGDDADEADELLGEFFDGPDDEDDEADLVEALEQMRTVLPYEVVPDGMGRPKAVKDALVSEFGLPGQVAESITSHLSGFDDWAAMEASANAADVPKGVFDEDLSAAEFNQRRSLLTEVLFANGIVDQLVAERAVELLAPTAREGKPSLRRLGEQVLHAVASREELGDAMEDFARMLGFDQTGSDFEKMTRQLHGIRPKAWIDLLERFGWALSAKRTKVRKDASVIARTASASGAEFDVCLSAVTYIPGDQGDEHVEGLMAEIASRGRPAVLMFNFPLAFFEPEKSTGLLYGGRVFSENEWWDFVLRPGGSIDDALSQKGKLSPRPTSAFKKEYSFSDAREQSLVMAAATRGEVLKDGPVVFAQSHNGWISPLVGQAAQAVREAKEIMGRFG